MQANPLAEAHYPFIGWTRKSTQQAFRKMRRSAADLKAYNLQFVRRGFLYCGERACYTQKNVSANRDSLFRREKSPAVDYICIADRMISAVAIKLPA
jgi:hypothetical protein